MADGIWGRFPWLDLALPILSLCFLIPSLFLLSFINMQAPSYDQFRIYMKPF